MPTWSRPWPLFVALGGTGYAVNTVRSPDIVDGEVKSVDIGNNEIQSGDIKDGSINTFDVHSFLGVDVVDGSLTREDLSPNPFRITLNVSSVPAQSCLYRNVTSDSAAFADLVVTPQYETTSTNLIYTAENRNTDTVSIKVCNPTATAIDDGGTTFQALPIP